MQSVDLFAQLVQRGLKPSAAAAWLDTSPPLAVSVWVRVGSQHRGAQLEGSAVVVLDNGQDKGAATSEGELPALTTDCIRQLLRCSRHLSAHWASGQLLTYALLQAAHLCTSAEAGAAPAAGHAADSLCLSE